MDLEQKYRKRNLITYPLGTVGRDGMYQLFTNFILTFILFTRNLSAAQLATITLVMVLARVFDALNDPIMGYIIERTRTRFGKFKPWLAIGMLSTAAVIITAFTSPLDGWPFIIEFAIVYFLYSITFTMHDISYWGMIPSLSSDANTRNQYTSRATFFAGVGGTLIAMLVPLLTTGSAAIGGNTKTAYAIVAVGVSLLGLVFIAFTIFGVKEPNPHTKKDPSDTSGHASIKQIVGTIFKNRELMWVILIFLLQQIGNAIIGGGLGSTYVYFEFGYEGGLYSIFSTVGVAATAVLMIMYPMISRHINRKPLMSIMMIVSGVGYALMLGLGLAMPAGMVKFWIFTIGYMLANFGQYCFYLVLMISILNTVEYNEYQSGHREEAIIASVRPFLTKLASALAIALTSATYLIFKVTDYTNQIATLEQQASLGEITEEQKLSQIGTVLGSVESGQKLGILIAMTIVPCLFMLVAFLLYKHKYTLDEAKYDSIVAELAERHEAERAAKAEAAAGAESAPADKGISG